MNQEPYVKPQDVTSPRNHWTLIGVLRDGGPGEASYAVGTWDGEVRVAFRWNGLDGRPTGNPQSRGLPTWAVMEPAAGTGLLQALNLTNEILDLVARQHAKLNA